MSLNSVLDTFLTYLDWALRFAGAVAVGQVSRKTGSSPLVGFGVLLPIVGPVFLIGWVWYVGFTKWRKDEGNAPLA